VSVFGWPEQGVVEFFINKEAFHFASPPILCSDDIKKKNACFSL
jgi:hypothetical protein